MTTKAEADVKISVVALTCNVSVGFRLVVPVSQHRGEGGNENKAATPTFLLLMTILELVNFHMSEHWTAARANEEGSKHK